MNTSILVKTLRSLTSNYETVVGLSSWISEELERLLSSKQKLKNALTRNDKTMIRVLVSRVGYIKEVDCYIYKEFNLQIYEEDCNKIFYFENKFFNEEKLDLTKFLINNGAKLHKNKSYLLFQTINNCIFDMVEFLINKKSIINKTIITRIIDSWRWDLIELVISNYRIEYSFEFVLEKALYYNKFRIANSIINNYNSNFNFLFKNTGYDIKNTLVKNIIARKINLSKDSKNRLILSLFKHEQYPTTEKLIYDDFGANITESDFNLIYYLFTNNKNKFKDVNFDVVELILDSYDLFNQIEEDTIPCLTKYGRSNLFKNVTDLRTKQKIAMKAIKFGHQDIFSKFMIKEDIDKYLIKCYKYNRPDIKSFVIESFGLEN